VVGGLEKWDVGLCFMGDCRSVTQQSSGSARIEFHNSARPSIEDDWIVMQDSFEMFFKRGIAPLGEHQSYLMHVKRHLNEYADALATMAKTNRVCFPHGSWSNYGLHMLRFQLAQNVPTRICVWFDGGFDNTAASIGICARAYFYGQHVFQVPLLVSSRRVKAFDSYDAELQAALCAVASIRSLICTLID
jgi:hypothetical protein